MATSEQGLSDVAVEERRRDQTLLKLLKTPPQPRPKRERRHKSRPKDSLNPKKEAPAK